MSITYKFNGSELRSAVMTKLFKEIRPIPIRSKRDLQRSEKWRKMLIAKERRVPEENVFLELLGILLRDYQATHFPREEPRDNLRAFMEKHSLSQSNLSRETTVSQSTISDVLCGKCEISKNAARKFAGYFDAPVALFLG